MGTSILLEANDGFRDHWYQSPDGLKLYARDYSGPKGSTALPVLCMHGLTRNSADFDWIASHLAKTRRVVSVDQRGRGRSDYDSVESNYTPATYVSDMFTLLDDLGLERVLIIGTSMGGIMSMLMANMQPDRFAGIVINDIGPELNPEGLDRIKSYVGKSRDIKSWEDAIAQTREINDVAFPGYSDEEWLRFTQGLYTEVDGVLRLAYDPNIAKPMLEEDSNAVPPDLWPLFEGIASLPMLLIRGAVSDLLTRACAERMRELSPTLIHVDVPDRGHAPMLNEPVAVAAIDAFVTRCDP